MDYIELRRKVIKKYFSRMNSRQFEAVTTVNGPLLVLAGAGSGKTTVLVNRILNLVKFGNGYKSTFVPETAEFDIKAGLDFLEDRISDLPEGAFAVSPVNPWQILAITFTNKAAGELKDRIAAKLGDKALDIWAGTFHSVCGKILRRYADYIGYSSHFTIYDTDDQRRLMKELMKQQSIDDKFISHKAVLAAISDAKNNLITPEEYEGYCGNDMRLKIVSQLYFLYQSSLKKADAMDFDDMIQKCVELLQNNPDVLEYYTRKFRYCLVDEYQDTNHAQYVLVSLLASGSNNLCVVGDDDQSIYRFRGATIENILEFEDQYDNALTIRLEQNYRSTSNILDAANAVIKNNKGRKGKTLWTENGEGSLITLHTAADEREEARFVTDSILENVRNGAAFSDHAVLYRNNAQSNAVENYFARSGVAYKVIGGTRFYDRKEIRDVLAYLHLINNLKDDLRLKRIINEPKRGIGDTTLNKGSEIAAGLGISLFEVFSEADQYATLSKAVGKLKAFCDMMKSLSEIADNMRISELYELMLEKTGYALFLESEGIEGKERLENVKEFGSTILQYELENEETSLSDFLEQISLISDIDALDSDSDRVVLMTVHSAKGLEFENVYIVGMEEGLFPSNQAIAGGNAEVEEERRLAYVAITRAKKNLTVTNTFIRMLYGSSSRNMPSRFLKEIPEALCKNSATSLNTRITPAAVRYGNSSRFEDRSTKYTPSAAATRYSSSAASNSANSVTSGVVYRPGMQVTHKVFGVGMIISVTPAGNDTMLEIAFEKVGTKKIMANYAKLTI